MVIEARRLVVDGTSRALPPDIVVANWVDDPTLRLKLGEDGRQRTTKWVRNITLHTTQGVPGGSVQLPFICLPGQGPGGPAAERNARYWSGNGQGNHSSAGAHLITDYDGTHVQTSDLVRELTYHAGTVSGVGIGWEVVQGCHKSAQPGFPQFPNGFSYIYESQCTAVVRLMDCVTRCIPTIQRQLHFPYRINRPVPRIHAGAEDVVGIFGHNDATTDRGPGDPGGVDVHGRDSDFLRTALRAAGYEVFDFSKDEDLHAWSARQALLNRLLGTSMKEDGVPGPATVEAIREAARRGLPGFTHPGAKLGLWISRPGDETAL